VPGRAICSSRTLLGRARAVRAGKRPVDRGPHPVIGRGHQVRVDPQREPRIGVAEVTAGARMSTLSARQALARHRPAREGPRAEVSQTAEPQVTVWLTNGVRTSAGPGPGVKQLPRPRRMRCCRRGSRRACAVPPGRVPRRALACQFRAAAVRRRASRRAHSTAVSSRREAGQDGQGTRHLRHPARGTVTANLRVQGAWRRLAYERP
jgi:hypothetical protein